MERRNNSDDGKHIAKLVRDGTIINLVKVVISTFVAFAQIDKDSRGVPASQYLEIVEILFRFREVMYLAYHVDMNNIKSDSILNGVEQTLKNNNERNSVINLKYETSDIQQNVYADCFLGLSKEKCFRLRSVEGDGKTFWFPQMLLLFHLKSRTSNNICSCLHS